MDPEARPVRTTSRVRERDILIVVIVAAAALLLMVLFGAALFLSGLVAFPDPPSAAGKLGFAEYYNDALAYRERRLSLALLLRTFLTGFSFIVGLALCTMGGLFILRQVTSLTTLAGALGDQAEAAGMRRGQLSFQAYSPGVVFLLGGVTVMIVTQLFAIKIYTVDVTPPGGTRWCVNEDTERMELCPGQGGAGTATPARGPAEVPVGPDPCLGPAPEPWCTGAPAAAAATEPATDPTTDPAAGLPADPTAGPVGTAGAGRPGTTGIAGTTATGDAHETLQVSPELPTE